MNQHRASKVLIITAFLMLLFAPSAFSQTARKLNVKVTYQGTGEVNSSSGIHLYLFDNPNISEGSMPIGMTSVHENGGVAAFEGLSYQAVYVVGAYGDYDPMAGPPPTGTPVAFFRPGDPAGATAIPLDGEVTEISFEFDDSIRMP